MIANDKETAQAVSLSLGNCIKGMENARFVGARPDGAVNLICG